MSAEIENKETKQTSEVKNPVTKLPSLAELCGEKLLEIFNTRAGRKEMGKNPSESNSLREDGIPSNRELLKRQLYLLQSDIDTIQHYQKSFKDLLDKITDQGTPSNWTSVFQKLTGKGFALFPLSTLNGIPEQILDLLNKIESEYSSKDLPEVATLKTLISAARKISKETTTNDASVLIFPIWKELKEIAKTQTEYAENIIKNIAKETTLQSPLNILSRSIASDPTENEQTDSKIFTHTP